MKQKIIYFLSFINRSISRSNFKRNSLSFGFLRAANKNPSRPVLKSISPRSSGVSSLSRLGDDVPDLLGVDNSNVWTLLDDPALLVGLLLLLLLLIVLLLLFGFRFNSTIFLTSVDEVAFVKDKSSTTTLLMGDEVSETDVTKEGFIKNKII